MELYSSLYKSREKLLKLHSSVWALIFHWLKFYSIIIVWKTLIIIDIIYVCMFLVLFWGKMLLYYDCPQKNTFSNSCFWVSKFRIRSSFVAVGPGKPIFKKISNSFCWIKSQHCGIKVIILLYSGFNRCFYQLLRPYKAH